MVVDRGDRPVAGVRSDLARGEREPHRAPAGPRVRTRRALEAGGDEGGDVAAGHRARGEAPAVGEPRTDAVHAEQAPIRAIEVPAHEVPAAPRRDQVVRLHPPQRRLGGVAGCVVEAQGLAVADRGRDGDEDVGSEVGAVAGATDGGDLERVEAAPQPRRQDLPDRGEGPARGLLEPGGDAGRRAERQRHGQRLVVVEQERRELGPGGEAVAAVGAQGGVEVVAHLPQALDVAAHGATADAQAVGQE